MKGVSRFYRPTRKDRSVPGYLNRNSLNEKIGFSLWVIEASSKMGSVAYPSRKMLKIEYGILDGVRHLGPRRREIMAEQIGDLDFARLLHNETWKNILQTSKDADGTADVRHRHQGGRGYERFQLSGIQPLKGSGMRSYAP